MCLLEGRGSKCLWPQPGKEDNLALTGVMMLLWTVHTNVLLCSQRPSFLSCVIYLDYKVKNASNSVFVPGVLHSSAF